MRLRAFKKRRKKHCKFHGFRAVTDLSVLRPACAPIRQCASAASAVPVGGTPAYDCVRARKKHQFPRVRAGLVVVVVVVVVIPSP